WPIHYTHRARRLHYRGGGRVTEIHAFDPDGAPSPGAQIALDAAVDGIDTDAQGAEIIGDDATEVGAMVRDMFPSGSAEHVEYWVAPDGSDTDPGTESRPFRTIAHAVSLIPDVIRAGHEYTISLMPGDWNE